MAGISLTDALTLPDPAPAWQWQVRMPSLPGGTLSPLYVEEIEVNFFNVGATGAYSGGTKTYYPDVGDTAACSITFYEDVNYTVFQYVHGWRSMVCDPITNYYGLPYGGPGGGYKKKIYWDLYNGVTSSPVLSGVLDGAFPTDLTAFSLNFSSSDRIRVACSFSVDNNIILGFNPNSAARLASSAAPKKSGNMLSQLLGSGLKGFKNPMDVVNNAKTAVIKAGETKLLASANHILDSATSRLT